MKYFLLLFVLLTTLLSIKLTAQVNTERFRQDEDTVGFSGYVDLEGVIATGNTDFQLLSLGSRLNYNWGDDYTFLIGDGGYGWESGNAFVDQILFHLRHVITTSDLLQIELFTQFDNNKKRLLLERYLLGGGLRFRLVKTDHFKFRLGTAYMLEKENYDLSQSAAHPKQETAHRFTGYTTFAFNFNETLSFISTTYFQPKLDDLNDYKIFSENALLIDTGDVLDLFIKFNLRYDSKPPDTIKNFDTISRIGFSFKFGEG